MQHDSSHAITQLLSAAAHGDLAAQRSLWDAVYQELRQLARSQMALDAPGRTLQPTALVNEAYLRLMGGGTFENRRHFFAAAARAMHQILVDDARRRGSLKRGGNHRPVALNEDMAVFEDDPSFVLAIDEAMEKLRTQRPDLAEMVQLRFFAGLTLDETAEVLGVARRTVVNQWNLARAILYGMLADEDERRAR